MPAEFAVGIILGRFPFDSQRAKSWRKKRALWIGFVSGVDWMLHRRRNRIITREGEILILFP